MNDAKALQIEPAIDNVRERFGMIGVRLQGCMCDKGNCNALVSCNSGYSKQNKNEQDNENITLLYRKT